MTWVKLDDGYYRHPKSRALGKDGRALHIASMCWCAANLTDGVIRRSDLPLLLAEAEVKRSVVNVLVESRAWLEHPDGWEVNDFLTYNRSAASVRAERDEAAERMRRNRERRSAEHKPNVPPNTGRSSVNPDPTRPDPTPVLTSPPPPESVRADPHGGGGGGPDPFTTAVTLVVDAEQARERNRIEHPDRWRAGVAKRINADHGATIRTALAEGLTPTQAAARILEPPVVVNRADPAEANARSMVAGLILTGTTPADTWRQALDSHPAHADAIADELAHRTGWTPPDTRPATITPIRGAP